MQTKLLYLHWDTKVDADGTRQAFGIACGSGQVPGQEQLGMIRNFITASLADLAKTNNAAYESSKVIVSGDVKGGGGLHIRPRTKKQQQQAVVD